MKNKIPFIAKLSAIAPDYTRLTLQLFFTFICIFSTRHQSPFVYLNFAFFIALLLQLAFIKDVFLKPLFWFTILYFLLLRLFADFYLAANHLFVCIYITFAILLYLYSGRQLSVLQKNFQWVLGVVLFFSGFQKLLSPQYMDGSFFEYMLYRGDFLWPLKYISGEFAATTAQNKTLMQTTAETYANATGTPLLTAPVPYAIGLSKIMSQVSVWMEILAGIAVFINAGKWYAQLLAAITITGVAITRQEFGFLSLLTIMALPLCRYRWLQAAYVVLIVLFHAGIIIQLGFL